MNTKIFLLVSILTIVCTAIGTYLILEKITVDRAYVPYDVIISSTAGFNLEDDILHLGAIQPGGSAQRNFTITNQNNYPVKIKVIIHGQMSQWTLIHIANDEIKPSESAEVVVALIPPLTTTYGNYSGIIEVKLIRSFFGTK